MEKFVPRRPSDALSDIRFARYPAEIVIEVDTACSGSLTGREVPIRLVSGSRYLDAQISLMDDQILVGHEWFPLSTDLLHEVAGVLEVAGINQPGELLLKEYLALRKNDSRFLEVGGALAVAPIPSRMCAPGPGLPIGLEGRLYPYQNHGF